MGTNKRPDRPGRETGAERRARLEDERKSQRRAERKRTLVFAGVGVAVGALVLGGTGLAIWNSTKNDPTRQAFSSLGVSADAASCDETIKEPTSGVSNHVQTPVEYTMVPPTSGAHNPYPMEIDRKFYEASDKPPMERLVHNLEHGYNIVWYTDATPDDQVETLRVLSDKIGGTAKTDKFIVSAWDPAYGAFPEGKTIGMSHWGQKEGSRQLCGQVSGEAIAAFVDAHPASDSPEPYGA